MNLEELHKHSGEGLPFRVSLEAVNKGVGLVALGLPLALLVVWRLGGTCTGIDSISHYYYTRLGGDILVGALCLIGTLLLFFYKLPTALNGGTAAVEGYLGHGRWDIWAARFAGLCAFGVALSPTGGTGCEDFSGSVARVFLSEKIGSTASEKVWTSGFDFWATLGVNGGLLTMTHYISALGMFLVLAYFSLVVFTRPQSLNAVRAYSKPEPRKRLRNVIYRICGALILVAILGLVYKFLAYREDLAGLAKWNNMNLTFWLEALGLAAFGISWSVKGRVFRSFRDPYEAGARSQSSAR